MKFTACGLLFAVNKIQQRALPLRVRSTPSVPVVCFATILLWPSFNRPCSTLQRGKYKSHVVVPLGEWSRPKPCALHGKDLDLFCVRDQSTVCIYCLQLSGEHQHHQVISIADAVTKAKVCLFLYLSV